MGNACQNCHQNDTQVFTQEQGSFIKEESIKVIQSMSPIIKKHEYQLENLNEGIGVSTITSFIIKPKNQTQILEILRGIKNIDTEIRYYNQLDQGSGSPSSKNDSQNLKGKCNSERHVHFQIPQMQIIKHESKIVQKKLKK
ncbi:unnamed protein product [Paramecium sonneborni]|uniref:Uncharacterized protein n=1 Tax=Paramecium sonneborni TaxID=65129 RepID=A0A8S1PPK1_9CILI|nr:unnamed protein product [Paramecium sonneborni]